jgi:2-amino-4-hydroxy-6-hydroxymethyldihydropteridine diphosphokinase
MALAYLSLGSNLGDREATLSRARQALRERFAPVRFSSVYETEPVDLTDQPWFLNQVAEVPTDMPPETLLEWVRSLENRMGRRREIPKGPRTLDVDILLYDDRVLLREDLTLPHPRLAERRHVLVPLAELTPGLRLPPAGPTVRQALEKVKDHSQVRIHEPA